MPLIRRTALALLLLLVGGVSSVSAQNVLINPCGGSTICFGSGTATDVFVVTDGVKRIKVKFDGTEITPETTAVTSLGTSSKQFKDAQFSGTVTAATFSGTFSGAGAFTFLNVDHGTIAVNTQPTIDSTVTWSDAGVTFTGWLLNVTNTNSAAASKLIDLQVGGSTQFNVTRAGAGTFTGTATAAGLTSTASVRANTTYTLNGVLLDSVTAPTIASGFGTSPSIPANNGTAAFTVDVGTGGTASSGVITMPAATTGWICHVENRTGVAANRADQRTVQTATTTTSVTVRNQTISTGAALAWTASDVLTLSCRAY